MSESRKILIWGAIGGAALTALLYSRFTQAPLILLLAPVGFALAVMIAEGFATFRAGEGYQRRAGIGLSGWIMLVLTTFLFFLSFVT